MRKNNLLFLFIVGTTLAFTSTEDVSANEAHNMLSKLSDTERNSTFTKFLKQSNENCDAVIKNFFQGFDNERAAYWNVACRNKKTFVVSIMNDKVGSTKIMDCGILKMLKAGECFKKF
jgi:hypothetical protein